MHVKPKSGRIVRDPETLAPLPKDGREVPDTQYWQRRIRDGDVTAVEPKAETPKRKPAKRRARRAPENRQAPPAETPETAPANMAGEAEETR